MGYFNPFDDIYSEESDQHPHARTLRTGFLRKIADTFNIFAGLGSVIQRSSSRHIGLLDWATLGIPLLVDGLTHWLFKNFNWLSAIPAIILGTISLLTNIIRYSLAAILTLAASPLILLVHAVSFAESDSRKESINALPIIDTENIEEDENEFGSTKSLSRVLADKNLSYEDIQVDYQAITSEQLQNDGIPIIWLNKPYYNLADARWHSNDSNIVRQGLLVYTNAIVYQDMDMNLSTFVLDKNQQSELLKNGVEDLRNNPEKYMQSRLNFREKTFRDKTTLGNSDAGCQCCNGGAHILAFANTEQKSIKANKQAFDAMLQLNIGGLSRKFNTIQDAAFKDNFPEEDDNHSNNFRI